MGLVSPSCYSVTCLTIVILFFGGGGIQPSGVGVSLSWFPWSSGSMEKGPPASLWSQHQQ